MASIHVAGKRDQGATIRYPIELALNPGQRHDWQP
jgi:hypothetical protein|tara:strand:- start:230 stop:334 length:105 start_codon:yes stop_codon:yes gene_type:complete